MSSKPKRQKSESDLVELVPSVVRENCFEHHEGQLIGKVGGLYEIFPLRSNFFVADRISSRVRAEIGWFDKIIKHAPTVGSFYEAILRSALKEVLPSDQLQSSGFVYSTRQEKPSKQLDFIVYTEAYGAPLYRQ